MTGWTVKVRDRDLNIVGVLHSYERLEVVERFSPGAGVVTSWLLQVTQESPAAKYLAEPGAGVLMSYENVVVSGPVRARTSAQAGPRSTTVRTYAGVSDTSILTETTAWPVPAADELSQTDAYHRITGPGETVMRALVNANIGPAATELRRAPRLRLAADQGRGTSVTSLTRFDRLSDELDEIATASGLGYRVVQIGTALEFQVYQPRDLSGAARFSTGFGNVSGVERDERAPEVTAVVVGAGGEGVARKFGRYIVPTDFRWPGLYIEEFLDRRDIDPTQPDAATLMQQAGYTRLIEGAGQMSVSVELIDTPTLRYGRDFMVGDTVIAESIQDVVREAHAVSDRQEGDRVTVTIGRANYRTRVTPLTVTRINRLARAHRRLLTRR